ncbi:MAG: hypothetical protein K2X50_01955 [Gammaproteobacteria bacterium]|nr:hypothetical protein [Gammaproteobacteria bacterium]
MKKIGYRGTRISDNVAELIAKASPDKNSIGDSGLLDSDLPVLIELLNTNPYVTRLNLEGNNIGNQGAILLAKGLKHIKSLVLNSTNVGGSPEMAMALALSDIERLSIGWTSLNNNDAEILIANSRQTFLNIRSNWHVDEKYYDLADQKAAANAAIKEKARGDNPICATSSGESSPKRAKAEENSPVSTDDTLENQMHSNSKSN